MSEKVVWRRYRFRTYAEDYRPLVFDPRYPWWCSGFTWGADDKDCSIIIAYLPESEDLLKYWDDAEEVEWQEREGITFTDRFPKPEYFVEEK